LIYKLPQKEASCYTHIYKAFEEILNEESRRRYDPHILGPALMVLEMWSAGGRATGFLDGNQIPLSATVGLSGWHEWVVMLCAAIMAGLLAHLSVVVLYNVFKFLSSLGCARVSGGILWMIFALFIFASWRDALLPAMGLLFAIFVTDVIFIRPRVMAQHYAKTGNTTLAGIKVS
jgi:hypothetical protein